MAQLLPALHMHILCSRALRRPQIDPEGKFLEFFGKSLSRDEMQTKMAKCIDEWESAKWWERMWPQSKEQQPAQAASTG